MIKERLNELRKKMQANGIDVYFLNTGDYHMSEYIPEYFKVLRYFSAFSGSMAQMIVTLDDAYIFVDGRYHIQAENECAIHGIKVMKLGVHGVKDASGKLCEDFADKRIALDGKCVCAAFVKQLLKSNLNVHSIDLYSDIMHERASLSDSVLFELDVKYTGLERRQKIDIIQKALKGKCHIVQNLESIAYMLNLRGNDIAYTPVFMAYMIFYQGQTYLFINKKRLSDIIMDGLLKDGIIIMDYDEYYDFLKTIHNEIILIDENKVSYEAYNSLASDNKIYHMRSIIEDMKAIKNDVEIENAKMAHIYDGVAMVRFMKWLKEVDKRTINEYDAKIKINRSRLEYRAFDLSFDTIVGYNANAAMMHYSPKADKHAQLDNSGIILIDSGGQYFEGTTDITRVFALGDVDDEVKKYFTLVLKSMFNLQRVKFIEGLSGDKLDILARKDLWALGIDYRCGTGHGVGHVLSVHEMPPNIRYQKGGNCKDVPLKPGHIFSDEPGVYFDGKFGIRCENLLLCQKDICNEYGQFLSFKPLTMVPFCLDLVDKKYLDQETVDALNAYHKEVYDSLSPYLNEEEKAFLAHETRSI